MDRRGWLRTLVLLFTLFTKDSTSVSRKLNASQAFDDTWSTAADLENELEQKRAKGSTVNSNSGGSGSGLNSQWSGWSEWSTCSRTCDGGIMQQMRRCYNPNGCKGESIRYRICNMQPCPEHQDFRARQCAAYNDVPYDGTLYKWTPHYDYVEPCALTCRGRPAHLTEESLFEAEDPEHYDEPSVIVQLAAKVQDGTRCRSGSLDMCIQGKCLRVGCDLKLSSSKKIDACGICGGDGSSCSQSLYQWETAAMSQCSVTCGGGYKMSRPICRHRITGADVDDSLCIAANRPEPSVEFCNTHTCPPRWIADDWSACSRLCGPGYRERMVVCAEETNGIKTRVSDVMCRSLRPPTQESCLVEECPKWEVEEWSSCSKSCGQGIQMRAVECKSSDGSLSAKCDPLTKPAAAQQCNMNTHCNSDSDGDGDGDDDGDGDGDENGDGDSDDGIEDDAETVGVTVVGSKSNSKSKSKSRTSGGTIIVGSSGLSSTQNQYTRIDDDDEEDEDKSDEDEDDEEDDDTVGVDDFEHNGKTVRDTNSGSYNDQPTKYAKQTVDHLHHEDPVEPRVQPLLGGIQRNYNIDDLQKPSADPNFIKDTEWSPCSVTCGEGIQRRTYRCKIFLEYSRTIATVNDSLCEGPKPHDEVERCVEEPCMLPSHGYDDQYPRDSIKVGVSEPGKTYVWREQGYTSCSASCLGGVEELIINCVREDNGRVVSPFLCAPETKPEARVRTCNDRPCPPRWNYSDYTPCSKSCGIGIKTREVQCIHEVTRGGDNTMVVPNSMCAQPPPADRQYCNVLDCPVRWEVGEWSKCSHTCGYGVKDRKVECKQIMAQEHKIERPEAMCPSVKPSDKKQCNVKPCPPEDPKPMISVSNTTHIQHDPKKSKITLKVGGAGVVFFGTQVKIKCPVKRFNRTKIKWSKDHKPLARSRKFKVSKKGALRILDITFRDAGVYSCHAGLSSAEINIEVKAKPGQQPEDFEREEAERLVRERSGSEALTSADMIATDNTTSGNQTTRRRQQQQNGRERNRRPKSDGVQRQHGEIKLLDDEKSQLVQEAQDGGGLPQPASASSGGSRTRNLLAIPYFQALLHNLQFLWPFQKFRHSRGQHMLHDNSWDYGVDLAHFEQDEPMSVDTATKPQIVTKDLTTLPTMLEANTKQDNGEPTTTIDRKTTHRTHLELENTNGIVGVSEISTNGGSGGDATVTAGTGAVTPAIEPSNDFVFKWQTNIWSDCSQRCGADGIGLRHRTVFCVRLHKRQNFSKASSPKMETGNSALVADDDQYERMIVDNAHCAMLGTDMPDTFELCGNEECPRWVTGEWTLCQNSRCFERNIAIQRRAVSCRYSNGTLAPTRNSGGAGNANSSSSSSSSSSNTELGCEEYDKPISRQECYNERCKGVWRVEPWSECNAPCGRQGIKYRILQCVWYGTRRPAGNACKQQNRPAIMKVCKSAPCLVKAQSRRHCKDSSRYCRNVQSMGLCRLHRYKEKCCKSCKFNMQFN